MVCAPLSNPCLSAYCSPQLGCTSKSIANGTNVATLAPKSVKGLTSVVAVGAYGSSFCAVRADGGVSCWGLNKYGQLGDGTTTDRSTPVQVTAVTGADGVSIDQDRACAHTKSNAVVCWGKYGVSTVTSSSTSVSWGTWHGCVTATGGGVACWGDNYDGQLGDGTKTNNGKPVAVQGL